MDMKEQNSCKEVEKSLEAYVGGKLSREAADHIEEHLAGCEKCRSLCEDEENRLFMSQGESPSYDAKLIERRFTKKVMGRVLIIGIAVLAAWYLIFTAIPQTVMSRALMKKSTDIGYAVSDLVQFAIPGAQVKSGNRGGISMFDITSVLEYEQRLVGGGLKTGKIDLAAPVYIGENDWKISATNTIPGNGFVFDYPQKRSFNSVNAQLDKLSRMSSGTKTWVAVYFEAPVSLDGMKDIITTIDADDRDSWYALDTEGLELSQSYRDMAMFSAQWGFPMSMELTPNTADNVTKDSSGRITTMDGGFAEHDIHKVAKDFMAEMKWFEGASVHFASEELTRDVENISKHMEEKGISIRGAILAAPTANLLKLGDNSNVARIDIIKVDFDY